MFPSGDKDMQNCRCVHLRSSAEHLWGTMVLHFLLMLPDICVWTGALCCMIKTLGIDGKNVARCRFVWPGFLDCCHELV